MSTGETSCKQYGQCERPVPTIGNKEHCDKACTGYEPKCKTCGGSGEIENPVNGGEGNKWDCPDCKPAEPEGSEFTKRMRTKYKGRAFADCRANEVLEDFSEACDIIDHKDILLKNRENEVIAYKAELKDTIANLDAECRVSQMLLVGQKKLKAELKKLKEQP